MKSKILSSILFGVLLLVLNGCNAENDDSIQTDTPNGESTQTDTSNRTYIEQNIVHNDN